MTGRYPCRYGLQTLVIPTPSKYGLPTDEWLLPQALKQAGYRTAMVGKWHLGHADRKFWPRQRGFDYHYGAMIGEIDYFTHSSEHVLDWYRDNQPVKEEGYVDRNCGVRMQSPDQRARSEDAAVPLPRLYRSAFAISGTQGVHRQVQAISRTQHDVPTRR